tara:strand:+ start:1067 stop:1462 length:396 start_codon:yes stop_codon:yes gene_type:complete
MEKPTKIPKEVLPYIEHLEAELKKFTDSTYSESYLTIFHQLRSFNEQLQIGGEQTRISDEGVSVTAKKGFIDLFAEKDDKSFDRTKWYFENILSLNKTLEELKKLMTPEERENIKTVLGSTAEQHIFNNKK